MCLSKSFCGQANLYDQFGCSLFDYADVCCFTVSACQKDVQKAVNTIYPICNIAGKVAGDTLAAAQIMHSGQSFLKTSERIKNGGRSQGLSGGSRFDGRRKPKHCSIGHGNLAYWPGN